MNLNPRFSCFLLLPLPCRMVPFSFATARTKEAVSPTPSSCCTSRRSTTSPSVSWRTCKVMPLEKRAKRMKRWGQGRKTSALFSFHCVYHLFSMNFYHFSIPPSDFQQSRWDYFSPPEKSTAPDWQQEPGQALSTFNLPCTPLRLHLHYDELTRVIRSKVQTKFAMGSSVTSPQNQQNKELQVTLKIISKVLMWMKIQFHMRFFW